MPLTFPLRTISALVRVQPPPSTLRHSTAILQRLQAQAQVLSFQRAPETDTHSQDHATYQAVFASQADYDKASDAQPYTVEVDQNLPDPADLDPWNIVGYQQRQQPTSATFTAHVSSTTNGTTNQHSEYRAVKDDRTAWLEKALYDSDCPLGLVKTLSTTLEPGKNSPEESHLLPIIRKVYFEETANTASTSSGSLNVISTAPLDTPPKPLDLDALYKATLQRKKNSDAQRRSKDC